MPENTGGLALAPEGDVAETGTLSVVLGTVPNDRERESPPGDTDGPHAASAENVPTATRRPITVRYPITALSSHDSDIAVGGTPAGSGRVGAFTGECGAQCHADIVPYQARLRTMNLTRIRTAAVSITRSTDPAAASGIAPSASRTSTRSWGRRPPNSCTTEGLFMSREEEKAQYGAHPQALTCARRGVSGGVSPSWCPHSSWQTTVTLPMSASRCHSRGPLL
jgi:hypothetical protein